jgi:HSP20 family protein
MRALMPWTPFRELTALHDDLDTLLARFFGDVDAEPGVRARGSFVPVVESFVRDGQLVVRADLPGIDPKKVELALEGDRLIIKGERKDEREEKKEHTWHREVTYGRFERVLTLPAGIDPTSIKAGYHDGVLEVTMKAPTGASPKKVPITVH